MSEHGLQILTLRSRLEKTFGAMFRRDLGNLVLVFPYRDPAPRIFHTFFCPPLRIIALTDQGRPLMNRVVRRNAFIQIPPSRLIIECASDLEWTDIDFEVIADFESFFRRKE